MLTTLKTYYKQSEFVRNAFVLMIGTGIAQLIPILSSPVLTRLYTPTDFSTLAIFISFVSILSSIATARYDMAIMLPKLDEDSILLIKLSTGIAIITGILSFFFIAVFNSEIAAWLNDDNISIWLYVAPISIIAISLFNTLGVWFNRTKAYTILSINKIFKSTAISGVALILGLIKSIKGGLIMGQVIGEIASMVWLLWSFISKKIAILNKFPLKKIAETGKQYKDFPLYNLPTTLLDTLANETPIFLLSAYFTSVITGSYFFAVRILYLPVSLIGTAIAQIFYQKFTELITNDRQAARRFLIKIWAWLFIIFIIPSIIILLWGSPLFTYVFGNQWHESGKIASFLIPMVLFKFISSPTSTTYIVLRIQRYSVYFGIAVLIYRISAIFIGVYFNNFYLGLKILIIAEILEMIIYNYVAYKKI